MADVGRPTVITGEVLRKLEEAFAMGCTDLEACLYADISKTALYEHQQRHPEFAERKEKLKETPILLARTTVIKNLRNPQSAQWYLERKKKNEFAQRNEFTGPEGQPIPILAAMNVSTHNSNQENSEPQIADKSGTGRNLSEQDSLDTPATNERSPERQEADPNLGS
jgi:hypothetical protein